MAFYPFPPILNPSYGTGVFRRRIRLENHGQSVLAGLEDTMHACRLVLHHQNGCIAGVDADWVRYPTMTCPGATTQLSVLVGQPLAASWTTFREYQDPRLHCTHLLNLLGLAAAHALRDRDQRQFDVAVPDLKDGLTRAQVLVDGKLVHDWSSDLQTLVGPAQVAGVSLFKGFTQWAPQHFSGDVLEAAYVLHMGLFVAGSRMFDGAAMLQKYPDIPHVAGDLIGSCYARQQERFDSSIPMANSIRDFTDSPDEMLQFMKTEAM